MVQMYLDGFQKTHKDHGTIRLSEQTVCVYTGHKICQLRLQTDHTDTRAVMWCYKQTTQTQGMSSGYAIDHTGHNVYELRQQTDQCWN